MWIFQGHKSFSNVQITKKVENHQNIGKVAYLYTVNVDIFACIHFREFTKIGNFAWT